VELDNFIAFVAVLVVLSGAAERLVEIIKGLIPFLNQVRVDPKQEELRKAGVHLLAVGCCVITASLAYPQIVEALGWTATEVPRWVTVAGMGLLAAGGSSLWNSVLGYLVSLKNIKKAKAGEQVLHMQQQRAAVAREQNV
jgi:protein-S-isoprenylcysteine O-methyltransferase Ste14